ncbi:MAG: nucleotidyltransferase family protein [Myxococcota bacterium]
MKALVLCGGYGKRLGNLTVRCPKPLLDLAGVPLVGRIFGHLKLHGFDEILINTHYRAADFSNALGDGARWGVKLHYVYEPELLGTAGTCKALLPSIGSRLLVHYGDVVHTHDLANLCDQHVRTNAEATIVVHRRRGSNSFAELDEHNRIVRFVERPDSLPPESAIPWAFSGIALLERSCIAKFSGHTPLDLPKDVFTRLAPEKRLFAHPLQGFRCAVDSPERLKKARQFFLKKIYNSIDLSTVQATSERQLHTGEMEASSIEHSQPEGSGLDASPEAL